VSPEPAGIPSSILKSCVPTYILYQEYVGLSKTCVTASHTNYRFSATWNASIILLSINEICEDLVVFAISTMMFTDSKKACQFAVFLISAPLLSSAFSQERSIARLPACPCGRSNRIAHVVPVKAFKADTETKSFFHSGLVSQLDSNASALDSIEPVQKEKIDTKKTKILKLSTRKAVAFGMLLALTSGFVNGACLSGFLSATQATAAVTSTWTLSAIALASQRNGQFLNLAKFLLSFLGGSTIAGLLVPNPVPFQINNPKGVAMGFGFSSMALAAAGLLANAARFGGQNFLYLCLFANGIQNSLTSSLTSNLCRTSHFSGMTSDMGTYMGQFLRGNHDNVLKLQVFPLLSLSFWLGGFASYPLARLFDARILLLAAGVYGSLAASLGLYASS
jgi:hypothetical protein